MFTDVQESCLAVIKEFMPTVKFVFAYQNGAELVTPYCTIEVKQLDTIGREEVSTLTSGQVDEPYVPGNVVVREIYEAIVKFEFIGKDTKLNHGGDLATEFNALLATPKLQESLAVNNLSFMRKGTIRRIPKMKDTSWYNAYAIDVTFAFLHEMTQKVDGIDSVSIQGTFQDGDAPIIDTITVP